MTHELWANFDDMLQLVGYEMEPLEAEAGDQIHLELLWRAWDAPLPLIQMTVELRDDEGRVQPGEGGRHLIDRYPSILWEGEELVRDLHHFQIPADAPPGNYELALTLQRIITTEQRETLPFWSESGGWEESFTLGTVQITPL